MTRPHSQPAYAVLLTDAKGKREFLSIHSGIISPATRKQAQNLLTQWRNMSIREGVKAKVVKVEVKQK